MAIYIPEETLSEIRNTANIADIISERVVLKKAGKDYVGLCPFHSEKTPSFTVSPTKQIYHCFGCGAGGDVFTFLMKVDGIAFSDAVAAVARRYGIQLPEAHMTPAQKKTSSLKEQLLELNKQVMDFYAATLAHPFAGQPGRAYLEKRGFHPDMIEQFGIGFAPDGWDHLVRFFKKNQVPSALAEQSGLIVPRKDQGFYDRFRHRVMFPIFNVSRQVIGFGGRVLDDAKPKYLNSPETPVYNKSASLYGAHAARNRARETGAVYIVEGYFDLLALHQHGVTNAVATLGTSLTADHVRLLSRGFAQKALLLFDSDEAGLKAARRSISLFMNAAMDAAVIVLPKGYDPDSFIFEYGREAFDNASEKAVNMIEFLIESAVAAHGLTVEGKVRIMDEIKTTLSEIHDPVARSLYVKYLAERLGVDERVIMEKIQAEKKRSSGATNRLPEPGTSGQSAEGAPVFCESLRFEKQIISMMVKHPDICREIKKRRVLDYFADGQLIAMARRIMEDPPADGDHPAAFMNRLESDEARKMMASVLISDDCWDEESCGKLLSQFINSRSRRHDTLLSQIRAAEESHDDALLFALLRKKQEQSINR
ncbi:MAG: DNA primase [Desulfobacterales bacterium CG23_combo_of_CG06-09_8_20_14_all_51_8]|nr:MAG: DNA primase [Desulfobacterales bacterium CG23_combo_of_CG06-09_8_20_14_all_51_8]